VNLVKNSFHQLIDQLYLDPKFNWLTICNKEGEKSFSYNDLFERLIDYSYLYQSHKIKPGETVLIILKESIDLFAAFIAGVVSGVLPAYYAYPSPKQSKKQFFLTITDLLQYNEIKMIIGYPEVINILQNHQDVENSILVRNDNVKETKKTKIAVVEKTQEAFLQFSSGTTGAKKGVKISAEALFNQIDAYKPHVQFDQNSIVVSWLPHYHDMGLIACMLMPLFEKVPVVMLSPFEWVSRPASLLENIQKYKGTHTWQPNFALGHLVKSVSYEETKNYDLSSLKKLVCCSEPVLYKTVEKFTHHFASSNLNPEIIHNCYAMAENTFAMTVSDNEKLKYLSIDYDVLKRGNKIEILDGGFRIASAGKPINNTRLKILSDRNAKCSDKEIGEIMIKSNCMLEGYHNNQEATEKSFLSGWFNTGDLGFIYDEELYVTGRKKELIIVGGENIYPQDIEQIINAEKYYFEGRNVVFGIQDNKIGTEKIIALAEVSIDKHKDVDILGLRSKIFNQLNISISDIILLPPKTLIKSTAGKISRYLNRQAYNKGIFDKHIDKDNNDKLQLNNSYDSIEDIIQEIIPINNKIDIDDDTQLFASGLIDSFGFIDLIINIETMFNIQIPDQLKSFTNFQSIKHIMKTVNRISKREENDEVDKYKKNHADSLRNLELQAIHDENRTFHEVLIKYFPFKETRLFPWFLRMLGMRIGKNVKFLEPTHFKIRGHLSNIIIGDDVKIGRNVDIRNREDGQIKLNNKCYIDDGVRLVAARSGKIELGVGTSIGKGTVVNSGGDFITGKYCLIAGNVNISSSDHMNLKNQFIKEQSFTHGKIYFGNDVWIGSGATVLINSRIGDGAIISSNSLVSGNVPDFTIFAGVPARFIRNR
jgi:fatty-acyl-CoA synthase